MSEKKPSIVNNDSCAVTEEPLAKDQGVNGVNGVNEEMSMILEEVCDIVISRCSSKLAVNGLLVAAALFESSSFPNIEQCSVSRC